MISRVLLYLSSVFLLYESFFSKKFWWKTFGNSDYLFPYSFFQSLDSFNSILQWQFPPSLYLFPDLIVSGLSYYLLYFLSFLSPERHFILTIISFQLTSAWFITKLLILNSYSKKQRSKYLFYKSFSHTINTFALLNFSIQIFEFNLDQILFTNHNGIILIFLITLYSMLTEHYIVCIIAIFFGAFSDSMYFILWVLYLWLYPCLGTNSTKLKTFNTTKLKILFSLTAIVGFILPFYLNYNGTISIGHSYFTKFLSIERLNSKNLISSFRLLISLIEIYWFYGLVLIFVVVKLWKKRLLLDQSIGFLGFSNLVQVTIYICFSRFFAMRYLPLLQFSLFWTIAQSNWRRFYFVISILFLLILASNKDVDFNNDAKIFNHLPYLSDLEEVYSAYPESYLCMNYWKARPSAVYSQTIPMNRVLNCDMDGRRVDWISPIQNGSYDSILFIHVQD